MPTDTVPGSDVVTVIDTMMFGARRSTAAFLVDADETVLIDTGLSTCYDALRDGLAEAGSGIAEVDTVIATHVHLDHVGALSRVVDDADPRVFCHPNAERFLTDPEATERLVEKSREAMGPLADAYGTAEAVDPDRVATVVDGDVIDCGGVALEVMHTPGHAPHHVSLFEPADSLLFVIDEGCVYADGHEYPTTPPPNFDLDATLASFDRFRERDPEVLLYGHYGANAAGVDAIDRHERALRDWVATVEEARATHDDEDAVVEAAVTAYAPEIDDPIVDGVLRRDARGVLRYLER
jgi:glyoxylase-like metal-dependent hydrolase (beta-lactamase superfamily II)